MAVALILSSSVAASRIGGQAQAFALAALGIDPILVPTVQFGAGPHKGGRGLATDPDHFALMLEDVERLDILPATDLMLTGHFSHPDQVAHAAETVRKVRTANPAAIVIVDPILGDEPKGLYIKPEVAEAVVSQLIPLAGWLTPNAWELGHITGQPTGIVGAIVEAARSLRSPALVTSAPAGNNEIGLILSVEGGSHLLTHPKQPAAPNGTGDVLAALFGAGLMEGHPPLGAAARAAAAVADLCAAAHDWAAPDLPIVVLRDRLSAPHTHVGVQRLG